MTAKMTNKIMKGSFEGSHVFFSRQHPISQHLNPLGQLMMAVHFVTSLALTCWRLESRPKSRVRMKPGTQASVILARGH